MEKVSRRSFLKLSSMFGLTALVPWKQQLDNESKQEAIEHEKAIAQPTSRKLSIDEIEEDLTKVLLWINREPIRGIVYAETSQFIDVVPWLGSDFKAKPFPGPRESELVCNWIGYPERFSAVPGFLTTGETLDVAIASRPDGEVLYRSNVILYERRESMPCMPPRWLKLRPETLAEFHNFMEVKMIFKGVESWQVYSLRQGIEDLT